MIRYAITDGGWTREDCARWAAGGVDYVQLRDKAMSAGELTGVARELVAGLAGHAKVLVNGRVDVALAAGAAGVHLTAHQEELTVEQARRVFPGAVVSVSCHTLEEVRRASDGGADLILFGPVFEKRVDGAVVMKGVGLEALREACEEAGAVRVLALGGVTEENSAACVEAGAAGVAAIRLFRSAEEADSLREWKARKARAKTVSDEG